jgi:hypothetical protein
MVSIVIYGIIAIALAAAAGYAMLVFTSTAQQTTQMQENSVRLEQAVTALRASLRSIGAQGVLYLPAGTTTSSNGVSYTGLPASLGVAGAAPWGIPYQYCPVAPIASSYATSPPSSGSVTNGSITSADSTTGYSVTLYSDASTGNTNYVIQSPALSTIMPSAANIPSNVLGFITSNLGPSQNGGVPPSCDQITFNANGLPLVKGGTVRAIAGGLPYNQRAVAATDRLEIYTTPGDGSGDSTGVDSNNPMTFSNAIAMWRALQPRLTIIYLSGDSALYDNLDATTTATRINAQGEMPALVFAPQPSLVGVSTPTLTLEANLNLMTPVTFQNVTVSAAANLTINAFAPLMFKNAILSGDSTDQIGLNMYNSNLSLIDSGLSYVQLTARQSKIALYDLTTTANSLTNTNFVIYDSDLSFGTNPNGGTVTYTVNTTSGTLPSTPITINRLTTTVITTTTNAIDAENSNVFLDKNAVLNINDGGLSLVGSKYLQYGTLSIVYPSTTGVAFALDGGSIANLYQGSTNLSLSSSSTYGFIEKGNSIVSNYTPFKIQGLKGSDNCLYMDSSRFSQYASPTSTAQLVANCNSIGSLAINMNNNSVLTASGDGSGSTNGDIEVSSDDQDPIYVLNGSSLSLNLDQLKIATGASGVDDIYLYSSRLSAYYSNINVTNTGSWRGGITAENGQIALNNSNFLANHPYVSANPSAAIYLTRASQFEAFVATVGQTGSTASNACVLLENPGAPTTYLPAQSGTSAYFYPNTMSGVNGSPQSTVDTGVTSGFGFTSGTVAPSVGVTNTPPYATGTVDPTTLDQAIQNIINSENIGMTGNIRFGQLTCN